METGRQWYPAMQLVLVVKGFGTKEITISQ